MRLYAEAVAHDIIWCDVGYELSDFVMLLCGLAVCVSVTAGEHAKANEAVKALQIPQRSLSSPGSVWLGCRPRLISDTEGC